MFIVTKWHIDLVGVQLLSRFCYLNLSASVYTTLLCAVLSVSALLASFILATINAQ